MPTVRTSDASSLAEDHGSAAAIQASAQPLLPDRYSAQAGRRKRLMGWYVVATAVALGVFALGAVAGHTMIHGISPQAVMLNVEQVAPFDLMVKARDLPVQAAIEPF